VEPSPAKPLRESFIQSYADHYGYRPENRTIEVESVRVVASSGGTPVELPRSPGPAAETNSVTPSRQEAFIGGSWRSVMTYDRGSLRAGFDLVGPSLVFEQHCSTVVNGGWVGRVDDQGCLILNRQDDVKDRND
jgi:5-oxoprolinase (ATP-hydrolysing)